MQKQHCLLFCNCGAGIISTEKKDALIQAFKLLSTDVFELHDLCAFSLNKKDFLKTINQKYAQKTIVACYPRAIKNMFIQNSVEFDNFETINFRETEVDEIVAAAKKRFETSENEGTYTIEKSDLDVPAWFPIIDKSRCTLCGQCARFCVFGVYKYNKKSLEVANPLSCKNNCPACGRTCPASAIIFPRLPENSALSGAEPNNQPKTNSSAQNGNLFVMLNERNNRRNIFRQGVMKQAEEERQKALDELKKSLKNKDD